MQVKLTLLLLLSLRFKCGAGSNKVDDLVIDFFITLCFVITGLPCITTSIPSSSKITNKIFIISYYFGKEVFNLTNYLVTNQIRSSLRLIFVKQKYLRTKIDIAIYISCSPRIFVTRSELTLLIIVCITE